MALTERKPKHLCRELGPEVDILYLSDDNGHWLYQIKVNGRPDAELLLIQKGNSVGIRLKMDDKAEPEYEYTSDFPEAEWREHTRNITSRMLESLYPGCAINTVGAGSAW